MAGPPAECQNSRCGHVFEFIQFVGGPGAVNVSLTNATTRCPRCGSVAKMGDGTYKYADENFELIDGPLLTRDMVSKLASIAGSARSSRSDAGEIIAAIAEVSPELAEKLRSKGLGYFVIVLLLIWIIKSVSLDIKVDLNRLIDQASATAEFNGNEGVFDAPLPEISPAPESVQRATWAAQQVAPMSRQVRRQLARQSKKRLPGFPPRKA